MLEVSFYILPTTSPQDRDVFVCKLAEKAYGQGTFCAILTASESHSKVLDDLLWTFRASSFIPHQIITQNGADDYPQQILISNDLTYLAKRHTLINLSPQVPNQALHFKRILEIVHQEADSVENGRARYRYYQQSGVKLVTHKL